MVTDHHYYDQKVLSVQMVSFFAFVKVGCSIEKQEFKFTIILLYRTLLLFLHCKGKKIILNIKTIT